MYIFSIEDERALYENKNCLFNRYQNKRIFCCNFSRINNNNKICYMIIIRWNFIFQFEILQENTFLTFLPYMGWLKERRKKIQSSHWMKTYKTSVLGCRKRNKFLAIFRYSHSIFFHPTCFFFLVVHGASPGIHTDLLKHHVSLLASLSILLPLKAKAIEGSFVLIFTLPRIRRQRRGSLGSTASFSSLLGILPY